MTVVTGRIERLDRVRCLISLGVTELHVPDSMPLAGLEPGMGVTITCEERAGALWATDIKRIRL